MDATLSSRQLADTVGVSYRAIDYWCRVGAIEPARQANGSGTVRRWDAQEVPVVRAVAALMGMGATTEVAKRAAGFLRRYPATWWTATVRVTPDGQVTANMDGHGWVLNLRELADPEWEPAAMSCVG